MVHTILQTNDHKFETIIFAWKVLASHPLQQSIKISNIAITFTRVQHDIDATADSTPTFDLQ